MPINPLSRICAAQLRAPKVLYSCRNRQLGNNLVEEFIQIWVLGLVVFRVFGGGLWAEVGRQAAVSQDGGETGCHEDEYCS